MRVLKENVVERNLKLENNHQDENVAAKQREMSHVGKQKILTKSGGMNVDGKERHFHGNIHLVTQMLSVFEDCTIYRLSYHRDNQEKCMEWP